jgi:hypothetical protein
LDKSCGIWVVFCPDVSELLGHVVVEQAAVLGLGVIVAFEDNSDENLQENQIHHKHVANEVCVRERTTSATDRPSVSVLYHIIIARIVYARCGWSVLNGECLHD